MPGLLIKEASSYFKIALFTGIFWMVLVLVARAEAVTAESNLCLECHQDFNLVKSTDKGEKVSLYVNKNIINISVHRKISCQQCHSDATSLPHRERLSTVDCSSCHKKETVDYEESVHGAAWTRSDPDVPTCVTCHGKHDILKVRNPESITSPQNLISVCLNCHMDIKIEEKHGLPGQEIFKAYQKSVHGKALLSGLLLVAASCSDCHGAHRIKGPDDPKSIVNKRNIPTVCSKCHVKVFEVYSASIHGQAVMEGIRGAPVCTDCHGEHTIAKHTDPSSKVAPRNIPATCSSCHEKEQIAGQYGLARKRYVTYMNSYHGIANKYGQTYVANCSSCHDYHDVRPASDPQSSINPKRLAQTCGKCHPGATENFAKGKIHIEATKESSKGVFYVRRFYTWFISILISCFVIYGALDAYGRIKRRHREN